MDKSLITAKGRAHRPGYESYKLRERGISAWVFVISSIVVGVILVWLL